MDAQNKATGSDSFGNEENGDFAAARIREVEAMGILREAVGRQAAVQFLSGASWIRNVAMFTAINSVVGLMGARVRLVFGLGAAEVVNAIGGQFATHSGSNAVLAIPLVISLLIAGLFLGLHKLAAGRRRWAFWVAMGLYLADGAIFLFLVKDPLEVVCHGYALYQMWCGLSALKQLEA